MVNCISMRHQIGFYKDLRNITMNPGNSHIHIRAVDDDPSYHCPHRKTGSKFPK